MRKLVALVGLVLLTACGGLRDDLAETPEPIGRFLLGHNITVVNEPFKGPFSRNATDAEWQAAMVAAVEARLGNTRFAGDRFYHIGVAVEGYVLALPGLPLVYTPKSILIFTVNFFDDATQTKINEEPIRLTVFEPCCTIPLLGSGLTRNVEKQIDGLTFNAARAIERTMRQNADWFGGTPEVLEEDSTILEGNVLEDNPELVAPEQTPPADLVALQTETPADLAPAEGEPVTVGQIERVVIDGNEVLVVEDVETLTPSN